MSSNLKETGPRQHYIPQMLLRGFGKVTKRKRNRNIYHVQICFKEKKYIQATDNICEEDHFYSPKGDTDRLDSLITYYETNTLCNLLCLLNKYSVDEYVSPDIASPFIAHLAVRTAHFRKGMAIGVKRLVAKLETEVDIDRILAQKFDIHKGIPSNEFAEHITEFLDKNYPFKYTIPYNVIINVAFFLMRENKEALLKDTAAQRSSFFRFIFENADRQIARGHKKALVTSQIPKSHVDHLCKFKWKIEKSPDVGAILSDCVVITITNKGESNPYVFENIGNEKFIVIPINKDKLLVGSRDAECFSFDYNLLAANACDSFFVCSPDFPHITDLQQNISKTSKNTLFNMVDRTIEDNFKIHSAEISFNVERKHANNLLVKFLHNFELDKAQIIAQNIANIIMLIGNYLSTDVIESIVFTDTNFTDAIYSITNFTFDNEHISKKEIQIK